MKKIFYFVFLFSSFLFSQNFSLEEYKQFLSSHQNMSSSQLLQMHDAGIFKEDISQTTDDADYFDSLKIKYNFTEYEKDLIKKHGFMVSERLSFDSFGEAYKDIFWKDMPVFISTDAILHSVHKSYDKILVAIEGQVLIPELKEMLNQMHAEISNLNSQYGSNPKMLQSLKDYDIYFGIAKRLMGLSVSYFYPSNVQRADTIWNYITAERPVNGYFFSDTTQLIDFSQFTPRGHYSDNYFLWIYPDLKEYFKTMMWLGRTEFYLLPPEYHPVTPNFSVRRSVITSALIAKAAKNNSAYSIISDFDKIIGFLIGENDNVTLFNLDELLTKLNITDPADLTNDNTLKTFQDTLLTTGYAFQRINSQILMSDQMNPDSILPASSFLLMGQRFIIDSYITAQVVYDRIKFNNQKILRMVPSTLDVLFGLGNDAAGQLLQNELETYKYSTNLSALRFLIDSYDTTFWNKSLFNIWLNSIRFLNPPAERDNLPLFMRTGAYWQQKINTQLASWAELRHDNILYAKQSYTGGSSCSFPYGYVEPFPEFFNNLKLFGYNLNNLISSLTFNGSNTKQNIIDYCSNLSGACDTLSVIATKEISNIPMTTDENNFIRSMLRDYRTDYTGAEYYDGWYWRLYIPIVTEQNFFKKNFIVADVHTTPTDAGGNVVGWIKHVGTGPINLGTILAEYPRGTKRAYMGAFYSYYDYQTSNFLRLTDEKWDSTYRALAMRPDFVNVYLANSQGNAKAKGSNLITSVEENKNNSQPEKFDLIQNYPNPFNGSTIIKFTVPAGLTNENVSLNIYDIQGQLVKRLVSQPMSAGNYLLQWNGDNQNNITVSSGIYFCRGTAGKYEASIKLMLLK